MQIKYFQCAIAASNLTSTLVNGVVESKTEISLMICNAYDAEGAREAALKLGGELYTNKVISAAVVEINELKLRALLDGGDINIYDAEAPTELIM